jgi:flagellar motor switch protein FliM
VSDGTLHGDVLSRDELDALLSTLADERHLQDAEVRAGVLATRDASSRGRAIPYPALSRAVDQWAAEQAHRLSSTYQTTIRFQLSRFESMTLNELAETIPPSDVLTVMEVSPPRSVAFLWLGRPLLFSLMALSYGARSAKAAAPVARPYTRIERRFYRHQSSELLASLDGAWSDLVPARSRVLSVDGLDRLYEDAHDSVLVATFEVHGLYEFGRMRLALPPAPFEALAGNTGRVEPARRAEVEEAVLDTMVALRVEAGVADLSLRELAGLKVGQVLPLESGREGSFVVQVEGRPKFRGLRGSVGGRLAIQITGRV